MEQHPETEHFQIYLDNARYQHAELLKAWIEQTKVNTGVTFDLKHLPAYSPNLNLIERLWRFLKREALYGRYHATFADFRVAIEDTIAQLPTKHKDNLASLMTLDFQEFDNVSLLAA